MGNLDELPAVLDVRDDLRRARTEADRDVDDDVRDVYDRLEDVTERDRAGQESVLDEVDNELLRLEERVDGEASRRIASARNRIRTYRESLSRATENLMVLETTFRRAEDEDETEVSFEDLRSEHAAVSATVVNEGDPREVIVAVGFYAGDEELHEAVGPRIEIDASEQRTVELETDVPEDAEYYTVTVLDAGEMPATGT